MITKYTGNPRQIALGDTVYHRHRGEYIPCIVTNYYFRPRKFTLVPVADMQHPADKRRLFYAGTVYTDTPTA